MKQHSVPIVQLLEMPVGGSDRELKQKITTLKGGLARVRALQPFAWQSQDSDIADAAIIQLREMPTGGSDSTLKKEISPIRHALAKVLALRPVTWYWKTDKHNKALKYGFIAQEVEEVLPDLVTEAKWEDGTIKKHLSTNDMTPYLVSAIKEQQAEIQELRRAIERLKK